MTIFTAGCAGVSFGDHRSFIYDHSHRGILKHLAGQYAAGNKGFLQSQLRITPAGRGDYRRPKKDAVMSRSLDAEAIATDWICPTS
jgi:hypothetical protein